MSDVTALAPRRVRPRGRRRSIEAAAAVAFAERGYHRVAMQDVANTLGITAPALYRHFENKYELFREIAMGLAGQIGQAAEAVPAMPADASAVDAEETLDALIDAILDATIQMRSTGRIYRWESRYLRPDDRRALRAEFAAVRRRLSAPVALLRPDLDPAALEMSSLAGLSAIASLTMHRTAIPNGALRELLHGAALRALTMITAVPDGVPPVVAPSSPPQRRKDRLVEAAIVLFAQSGYHEVTIEEIATAVDLTPSGVYRHFTGKSDILRTACERAATALTAATDAALACDDAREALGILEAAYIRFAVEDGDLMDVYTADVGALDDDDRRRLVRLQREHVDNWVTLLTRVRPEMSPRDAKFLVHAGLNVVADLSVARRRAPAGEAQRWIEPALDAVLGI